MIPRGLWRALSLLPNYFHGAPYFTCYQPIIKTPLETIVWTPNYVFPSLMDDTHIVGPMNEFSCTFDHLLTQLTQVGFKVNMSKCRFRDLSKHRNSSRLHLGHKWPSHFGCANVATPLWCRNPTLREVWGRHSHSRNGDLGVLRDSQKFRTQLQGSKHLALKCSLYRWKGLEA